MPNVVFSPSMNLPIPVTGVDPGPDYANNVNTSLLTIDSHNHSFGSGVQVTPSGLNINADLVINGNNLVQVRSTRYSPQNAVLTDPTDLACTYVVLDDLFYNDGLGNNVRITQNGAVAGTPGSIANLVPPASAAYASGPQKFIWQSGVNIPAGMDNGPVTIRNLSFNSPGVTLTPPISLVSDYTITFMTALPSTTQLLSIDPSGNLIANTDPTVLVPTGTITMFGGASAPAGYLLCNGAAVSRTTYANLFAVIATNYGNGDASTTFNVPDFRGIFPRGVDSGAGNDPDAASRTAVNGGNSGDNVGSFEADVFGSHTHSVVYPVVTGVGGATHVLVSQSQPNYSEATNTSAAGGNETRPKNLYVNFIIKI